MTTVTNLTKDVILHVNLIVEVLNPELLELLAGKIGVIIEYPGFGAVYITI